MKVFVTSALPYVNAVAHLGNIIGSTLSGDVVTRFQKMMGNDVIYLCGTDNFGSASTIKAKQLGIGCKELCEMNNKQHKEIYDWFNINFDFWGRLLVDQNLIFLDILYIHYNYNKFINYLSFIFIFSHSIHLSYKYIHYL